jgi:tetraacyldisaccharide 4'-kinase
MRAPEFWSTQSGPMAGMLAGLLAPLGTAWDVAGRLHRALVRPYRAPVAVICVGNLVAGGSGKTPVVLSLAGTLAAMGRAVHVVTRGYGGRIAGPVRVDPARHNAAAVGDEPLLIASRVPCWIARDRAAGVRAAVAAGADAILMDDGFQNPCVEKDLALVVVDTDYGFGNRRVIPAGPLRESVAAGLARADAIVLLGDGAEPAGLHEAGRPIFRAELVPVRGENLAGTAVVGFAGIGRPEKFIASLRKVGAQVVAAHPFPDHHRFAASEIAGLRQEAERAGARLVTTAKDWVRLSPGMRERTLVLEVEIDWRDAAAVARLVSETLRRTRGRPEPHAPDPHGPDHGPGHGYDRSAASS